MNQSTPPVMVLGAPARTAPIAAGLQRAGLFVRTVTAPAALRSPGSTAAAGLAILTWRPDAHPVVESEVYGAATGALHVWWGARRATVGPYVAPGFGPCPACLATAHPDPADRGSNKQLATWAAASTTLQALAVLRHGTSDLMGSSWTWDLASPGIGLRTWPWRHPCPTRGCNEASVAVPCG